MIINVLKNALLAMRKKPIVLWGTSLLYGVIAGMIKLFAVAPILSIPLALILEAGMMAVFLKSYDGREIKCENIFCGFRKENIVRVGSGMCWRWLWTAIWLLVPVVNIIKHYSYRFTPYILMENENMTAADALRESMRLAKGKKLYMFLTDLIIYVGVALVGLILGLLAMIPFVGGLFVAVGILYGLALALFLSLFRGIVDAAFYRESNVAQAYSTSIDTPVYEPDWECEDCHTVNAGGTRYCRACGKEKTSDK